MTARAAGASAHHHGGLQEEEAKKYASTVGEFLDFSASLNPYGPPRAVLEAAGCADVARYPDPDCLVLRQRLSRRACVSVRELLVGNGSSEIFHLLARAFAGKGKPAVLFAPAFGEYKAALEAAGALVHECHAQEEGHFAWDLNAALMLLKELQPSLVFIGLPNNPTGTYLSREEVRALARTMQRGILVLDEAYIDFVFQPWDSTRLAPNVAVVRSLTKAFAIPGLRIGYLVAPRSIVERARRQQPSWRVSAPAQAAALACLGEEAFVAESARLVGETKRWLADALRTQGFTVHEGAANFLLIKVGDAAQVRTGLLRRKIAVRDCASFGLPEYVRVSVRTPDECERLVAALREVRR
jgi:histidinol-phosphate aminotransferase